MAQPDLIGAWYQPAEAKLSDSVQKLSVIDYTATESSYLSDFYGSLTTVPTSGTFYLGFSELLDAALIETLQYNDVTQNVSVITGIPGLFEIWSCPTASFNSTNFTCNSGAWVQYSGAVPNYTYQYRPDGGYITAPDTPVYKFPPPTISISILPAGALPAASYVYVYVLSGKIANTEKLEMAQLKDFNGQPLVTPINKTPVAGVAVFQTNP